VPAEQALGLRDLAVLVGGGEGAVRGGGVGGVEVPAEQALGLRDPRVVRAEGAPADPVAPPAFHVAGDEKREQRLALIDPLAHGEHHLARLALPRPHRQRYRGPRPGQPDGLVKRQGGDAGADHLQEGVLGQLGVAGVVEGVGEGPGEPDAPIELADG
jgi:hypothetical protein